LGRLTEALEPTRAGLEMRVKQESWLNAAISAGNLSELELTLGEVAAALSDAEQSVTYAENSGDAFQRMAMRTTHADALHQAGRRDEAEARFREAEEIQAERQPGYPLLYSLPGFQYCDLLLAAAERAVWRRTLQLSDIPQFSSLPESCRAVSERAARTLDWAELNNKDLLSIALDHLTLGRAALYAAILQGIPLDRLDPCRDSLQRAVDGIRRAGLQYYLPRGLLTRAWLRCLTGARTGFDSAQSDLDEALEIAERGPMPLDMADIHLHRARLFGLSKHRPETYPWTSPQQHLAEARRLIEKHGYWRRKEELEDAEAVALKVPDTP
jgi:tetratricopeptide (TPR) repeat protein